ncbi:MmgE/PrpD family protein, partial [Thermodesulfobacteriota bacterium]
HNAAFVNGILCVRRDFDDTNLHYGGLHTSRAIVPTAFATAEHQGDIDGKEFITAAALGHDLESRIAAAGGGMSSIYMSTNFFGAAATAGRLLGLDDEKMRCALNFSYHQICGASGGGGSSGLGSLKGVGNGIASKAGIISAQLAIKGFRVDWDFLDEKNRGNFFHAFYSGSYQPERLTKDLGNAFMGASTSQKEFPCCHGQHSSIQAALGLIKEHNITPDNVDEVILHVSEGDYHLLAEPLNEKQNPQNTVQTQFSLCWGVASAIVYGEVGIRNFSEEALMDEKIREMASKVSAKPEKEFVMEGQGTAPAIVEIKAKDGAVYSMKSGYLFGSPENPMGIDDVAEKFRHCCQYSAKPIPEDNQDRVIEMIGGLEEVSDVGRIIRLLAV